MNNNLKSLIFLNSKKQLVFVPPLDLYYKNINNLRSKLNSSRIKAKSKKINID